MDSKKSDVDDKKKLYALIKGKVDKSVYHSYLKAIDAPPNCAAIVDVSNYFLECLELIEGKWREYEDYSQFIPVARVIAVMKEPATADPMAKLVNDKWWHKWSKNISEKEDISQIPTYNYQGKHPIYTSLCVEQDIGGDDLAIKNFRYLQLHLLIAYNKWDGSSKSFEDKKFLSRTYLAMKKLSAGNPSSLDLGLLALPPTRFVEKITKIVDLEADEEIILKKVNKGWLATVLNSIVRLTNNTQGRKGSGGGERDVDFVISRQAYAFNLIGSGVRLRSWRLDKDDDEIFTGEVDPKDLEQGDIDDYSPFETIPDHIGLTTPGTKSKRSGGWRSKYQLKHIFMANQELPYSSNQYTVPEISLIMESLSRNFELAIKNTEKKLSQVKRRNWSYRKLTDQEMEELQKFLMPAQFTLIVMMQVWLGREADEAVNIILSDKEDISGDVIQLIHKEGMSYWRFSVDVPETNKDTSPIAGQERDTARYMVLPDFFGFSSYFRKMLPIVKEMGFSYPLTSWENGYYSSCFNLLQKDILLNHGKRLSKSGVHLGRFLKNQLLKEGCDAADASLICGRQFPNSGNQRYYYCPDVSQLSAFYERTVKKTIEQVYENWPVKTKKEKAKAKSYPAQIGAVGVKQCPTVEAVQILTKELQSRIQSTIKEPGQPTRYRDPYERHNYFVAYIIFYCAYATSFRALNSPLPRQEWRDVKNNFCILSDKDGLATRTDINEEGEVTYRKPDSFFNSRFVPLTSGLKKQIEYWEIHRSKLHEIGMLYGLKRTSARVKILNSGQPFYLFEDPENGLRLERSRPSLTEKIVSDFFNFKVNSNRRFLRTELRMRGVSSEFVNAYMSHWAMAQQPWGQYSSFPIEKYRIEMLEALEGLSKESGWRPVKSPFRNRS